MGLKKEMFLAIFLGLLLGSGAAFALVKLPKTFLANNPTDSPTPTLEAQNPSPTTTFLEESLTLEILLPENQSLTENEEITISGKTKGNALVAISTPVDEVVVTAESDGAFSESVTLDGGSNEILIVATADGTSAEKRLIVNYSAEEL